MRKIEITMSQTKQFTPQEINDLVVTANYRCGEVIMVKVCDDTYEGVMPEDQKHIKFASDLIGY